MTLMQICFKCYWKSSEAFFIYFIYFLTVGLLTIQSVLCIGYGAVDSMTWQSNVKFLTYILIPFCEIYSSI